MRSGTWSARTFARAKPLRILAYVDARVRAFGVFACKTNSKTHFEVFKTFGGFCREIFQKRFSSFSSS